MVFSVFCITANAEAAVEYTYTGMPSYYYDYDELETIIKTQYNKYYNDYFFVKVCNTEWFSSDNFRSWYSSYIIFPDSVAVTVVFESGNMIYELYQDRNLSLENHSVLHTFTKK